VFGNKVLLVQSLSMIFALSGSELIKMETLPVCLPLPLFLPLPPAGGNIKVQLAYGDKSGNVFDTSRNS